LGKEIKEDEIETKENKGEEIHKQEEGQKKPRNIVSSPHGQEDLNA
jgi:hypothetical protein